MDDHILRMEGIIKRFPGVQALSDVRFQCLRGEVHALVGENGAGKSTLMKILSGAYQPDAGEIFYKGRQVRIENPRKGQELGIAIIMQEFNLLPDLSVEENIFLGREPMRRFGVIDSRGVSMRSKELLEALGFEIDPSAMVDSLTIAQRQFVEIAKALSLGADLLIMDEPSATLTGHELDSLFRVIRDLKERGVTIVYISHRLAEVFQIADRVTVLKDGLLMGTKITSEVTTDRLIEMMVGRTLAETFPPRNGEKGEVVLEVRNLDKYDFVHDVSFDVRKGEIVGLAGLVGAGRTELVRAVFGADRIRSGEIRFLNQRLQIRNQSDAVRAGIVLIPEDRKLEGLVEIQSIRKNITLPNLEMFSRFGIIQTSKEVEVVREKIKQLDIRAQSPNQLVRNLSGGNQQKVVLGKWLVRKPELIILDEPTRGIDVASKAEIYRIMRNLADDGAAVLMISSELPEILGMADRILVMHEGTIAAEFKGGEPTEEDVMKAATGGRSLVSA
jgi:ribose transport system ATP-binding protein